MNLLVRSLSPSGQGSSSGSAGSPGTNRSSRGNTHSTGKSFFHRQRSTPNSRNTHSKVHLGHSRSYVGDTNFHPSVQPHILFDLDADPPSTRSHYITPSSVTSPTSVSTQSTVTGLSKPSWLRLRQANVSSKFTSDRYSSPPTPSDFDYYEYFSNYARTPSDPGDVATSESLIHQQHLHQPSTPVPPIRLNRTSFNLPSGASSSEDASFLRREDRSWAAPNDISLDQGYYSTRHSSPLRRRNLLSEGRTKSGMVADTLTSSEGGAAGEEAQVAVSTGDHLSRSKLYSKVEASTRSTSVHYAPVTSHYYPISPPSISPSSSVPADQLLREANNIQLERHQLMLHPSIHSTDHHYSSSGVDYIHQPLYPSDTPGNRQELFEGTPVTRHHLYSHVQPQSNHGPMRPSSATSYYQFMDPSVNARVSFDYPHPHSLVHDSMLHQQQQMRHRHPSLYQVSTSTPVEAFNYKQIHSQGYHHPHQLSALPNHLQNRQQVSKYPCTTVPANNGNASSQCFRISFIETTAYIAQDIPGTCTSPEHLPPNHRFNKHMHSEWVTESIDELHKLFKPPSVSILVNVEKKSKYPFIIFGKLPSDFDTKSFVPTAVSNVLSPDLRINDGLYDVIASLIRPITPLAFGTNDFHLKDYIHTTQYSQLDVLFTGNEDDVTSSPVYQKQQQKSVHLSDSIVDKSDEAFRSTIQHNRSCPRLGYVILAFQTFPGEDSSKLEENWITWTGAQILYKYLPIASGLRRIVFFKRHDLHLLKSRHSPESSPVNSCASSSPSALHSRLQQDEDVPGGMSSSSYKYNSFNVDSSSITDTDSESPIISYVLLCECTQLTETILTSVCAVIDQLRARCCGYSALYVDST